MIKVEGLQELRRTLAGIEREVREKLLRESAVEAVEPMRQLESDLAPRGETGKLSENIAIEVKRSSPDETEIEIGPETGVFYGLFQEYGTRHHRAQPFARPAYDQEKRPTIRRARKEFKGRLRTEAVKQRLRHGR